MLSAFSNRLCELPLTHTSEYMPSSEADWFRTVFDTLLTLQARCESPEQTAWVAENVVFLFGRYAALLQQDRPLLETAIAQIFRILTQGTGGRSFGFHSRATRLKLSF